MDYKIGEVSNGGQYVTFHWYPKVFDNLSNGFHNYINIIQWCEGVNLFDILSITKENREIGVLSFGDGAVRTNPGNEIINISDVDKNSFRR